MYYVVQQLINHVITVYHAARYNTSLHNPCHSSACSHLCLLVPGGRRCACPDNTAQPPSHRTTAEVICDAGMYLLVFLLSCIYMHKINFPKLWKLHLLVSYCIQILFLIF